MVERTFLKEQAKKKEEQQKVIKERRGLGERGHFGVASGDVQIDPNKLARSAPGNLSQNCY